MKILYKNEFRPYQKREVQDVLMKRRETINVIQKKEGFFYKKHQGFSLSAIGSEYGNIENLVNAVAKSSIIFASNKNENVLKIALDSVEDVLKPNYVSKAEDEWWKKKKKFKR